MKVFYLLTMDKLDRKILTPFQLDAKYTPLNYFLFLLEQNPNLDFKSGLL